MQFSDLGLSPDVLRAVADSGYTTPTPIQEKAIPEVLRGRDLIGIAQTGTGKTASFTLPMIHMLGQGRAKARMPRSLILEPTRELAAQVAESFEKYGKYHKLNMALLIGGVSFGDQDAKITRGVDVLIATPGRLLDHFERGKLLLTGVQILVVDEADRMLDMGFIPDVERICKLIPFTRQTVFFSATMPTEIKRLTDQFLQNPLTVEVSRPATAGENIEQKLAEVPDSPHLKREALRRLIREREISNAIIFCNRKIDVDILYKSLKRHGFSVGALHGDLDQPTRMRTLDSFKTNEIQLLVASDVAARGLDIPAVSHVFNYDVPIHADDYVHRIGRTGRAGRSGESVTLATRKDGKYVEAIEKLTGKPIARVTVEGLEAFAAERADRPEHPRRERAQQARRSRGPRKVADHGERASFDAIEQSPVADVPVQAEPRPERAERRPRRERAGRGEERPRSAERPEQPPSARAPERREARDQSRGGRDTREPTVLGFGDSPPAFMMRKPSRVPVGDSKSETETEAA